MSERKVHHCVACRKLDYYQQEADEDCCTCCVASDGTRPGKGVPYNE